MMPFLPLVSFAAVAMGMLNAEERFGLPAFAPAMFNVVAIALGRGAVGAGLRPGAGRDRLGGRDAARRARPVPIQVPPLRERGLALPSRSGRPATRASARIGSLMAPATVGLAAVQVNIFVNTIFASYEPGAVSWLDYAFRILYLPIGIFGVAVGTVATTRPRPARGRRRHGRAAGHPAPVALDRSPS